MNSFFTKDGITNRTNYCNIKHGMYATKIYAVWNSMRTRCKNLNEKNYAGRGISIQHDWQKSFIPFMYWALNNGYKEGLEIDRIDNDKGYYEWNCRFVNRSLNGRNTRSRGKTSKYRGVTYRKDTGKWDVRLKVNLKQYYIGCYLTEKDALDAYNAEMRKRFPDNPELVQIWQGQSQEDQGNQNNACRSCLSIA